MKYSLTEPIIIANMVDVVTFLQSLYDKYDLAFHPDDQFIDYVDDLEQPLFNEGNALLLDEAMEACFFVCEKVGFDLYEVGHEIQLREFRKRGIIA